MNFNDFDAATRFRDVVSAICRQVIRQERPSHTYATVVAIDDDGTCSVQFPGESGAVRVPMGSLQPAETGVVVRVVGTHGDRYVDDVAAGAKPALDVESLTTEALVVTSSFAIGTLNTQTITNTGNILTATIRATGASTFGSSAASPAAEPIHVAGTSGGISYADRTTGTRYVTYGNGDAWRLYSSTGTAPGDRMAVQNNGQVNMSYDGVARNEFNMNALTVGSLHIVSSWNGAGIRVFSNGGRSAISFHAGNGAPMIQQPANVDELWVTNNAGSGFAPIVASAFNPSSERFKRDVVHASPTALGRGKWARFTDLNKQLPVRTWKHAGPLLAVDFENGASVEHVCGVHCEYDPGRKCPAKRHHDADKLGFTAEEVVELLPEAVKFDQETDLPLAIDMNALLAMMWGAVSELTDRVAALERPGPKV